jgi:hypothetical protein
MRGMHNQTGKPLAGIDHLRQRLTDVLTTPKGTRVMRREYGSDLFELLDGTMNEAWLVRCYAAIAEAIDNEVNGLPDFLLERVAPVSGDDAGAIFDVVGVYLQTGARVTVSVGVAG